MANKIYKFITLLSLIFATLGLSLTSGVSDTMSTPTKQAVAYADDGTNYNDHTHDGWLSLSQSTFDTGYYSNNTLNGGTIESGTTYYYLDEDIEFSTTLTINNYAVICLNGHTITGNDDNQVVTISSSAYVALYDCSENYSGTITGGENTIGVGVYVGSSGTFNMYGGSISGNTGYSRGGGVYIDGTFNMYDGIITNNTAPSYGGGVFILGSSAVFNMYGGAITENTAESNGGGVYVWGNGAVFNMYGGAITENTSPGNAGGVNIYQSNSKFNMYGGTISNNEGYYGGGVYVNYGSFDMHSGTISDNVATYGGGVYASSGAFTMYDGTIFGNDATSGGGVYVRNSTASFTMYGGAITENDAESYGNANNPGYYGGGVWIRYATFTMYGGTISDNTIDYSTTTHAGNGIYIYSAQFLMYGGYLKDTYLVYYSSTISICGGYFSSDLVDLYYNYLSVVDLDNYEIVDISLFGSYLDDNYVEGFDYAVYTKYTISSTISDAEISYGERYIPDIDEDFTNVAYEWNDGSNTLYGIYLDVGENYLITPHFLNSVIENNKTTNYYGVGNTFYLTITKGQAEITLNSMSKEYDGEEASIDYVATVGDLDITDDSYVTWYDNDGEVIDLPTEVGTYNATITVIGNDNYNGTSLNLTYSITEKASSDDNTGENPSTNDETGNVGRIVLIAVISLLCLILICVVVYFVFFRKKKKKASKK